MNVETAVSAAITTAGTEEAGRGPAHPVVTAGADRVPDHLPAATETIDVPTTASVAETVEIVIVSAVTTDTAAPTPTARVVTEAVTSVVVRPVTNADPAGAPQTTLPSAKMLSSTSKRARTTKATPNANKIPKCKITTCKAPLTTTDVTETDDQWL
jgi:hypothetical protein